MLDIPGKQEIINDWEQRFSRPTAEPESKPTGGGGGETPGTGGLPGAQYLPILGETPVG